MFGRNITAFFLIIFGIIFVPALNPVGAVEYQPSKAVKRAKILKSLPNNPLYSQALKEQQEQNYKKSLKTIEKIEHQEGANSKTALLKYRAFIELDMEKEAKEALNQALKFDKTCTDAHFALAVIAVQNDDASSARKYFKNIFELNRNLEDEPEILYWYAKLCALDNDLPTALDYILSAIAADPDENNYYLELGKIYLFNKDYIKAVNALSFAIGKNSKIDAESYNYLGLIQFRRKSYDKALECFTNAHTKDPENIMYLHNLLLCTKSLGDNSNYARLMQELRSITPKTPADYLHLSQIAHDKSDYMEADRVLNEGIQKFPESIMLKQAMKKLNKS